MAFLGPSANAISPQRFYCSDPFNRPCSKRLSAASEITIHDRAPSQLDTDQQVRERVLTSYCVESNVNQLVDTPTEIESDGEISRGKTVNRE